MDNATAADSATAAAWVAAAGAVAAALFAIWSAVSSHRAASSAADALAIERANRHDRLTPNIKVEDGNDTDDRAGIWFTNDSQHDYTSVRFRVEGPAADSPVAAFQVDGAWNPVDADRPLEAALGPMAAGDRRFVPYQLAKPMRGTVLRLRITCANALGTWPIYREVDVYDVQDSVW
jgi:hypothetical protein